MALDNNYDVSEMTLLSLLEATDEELTQFPRSFIWNLYYNTKSRELVLKLIDFLHRTKLLDGSQYSVLLSVGQYKSVKVVVVDGDDAV